MVKSSKNSIPSQRIQCYKINIPLYSNNNKRIMVVQIAITKKNFFLITNNKKNHTKYSCLYRWWRIYFEDGEKISLSQHWRFAFGCEAQKPFRSLNSIHIPIICLFISVSIFRSFPHCVWVVFWFVYCKLYTYVNVFMWSTIYKCVFMWSNK